MSPRPGCLLLGTLLLAALPVLADPVIVNANFGAVLISCSFGYAYQGTGGCNSVSQDFNSTPGFGWTLGPTNPGVSGSGLTAPNSGFNPPPFDGLPFTQAVFLQQNNSTVSQDVFGFSPGTYTLSFYLGSRYSTGFDGNQTVEALIDGNLIGAWALSSFTPFTLESATFTVGAGDDHTLEFMGINPGDHTAFLSDVSITPGTTPEPSSLGLIVTCALGGLAKWHYRR
jgi:hypothetical protein